MVRQSIGDKNEAQKKQRAQNELANMITQGRSFSGRERNCCFLNTRMGRFATVSAVSGLDYPDDGRCVAVVDWDRDGDLDLWISNRNAPRLRLMRNDCPRINGFLSLRLEGNGKTTNRDAIGARVEIIASGLAGKRLVRSLRAGEGFLSQSSKWVHFGLGGVRKIESVKVHWPGGDPEEFTGLEVDRHYLLIQGAGAAKPWSPTIRQESKRLALKPEAQEAEPVSSAIRIPMVALLPLPRSITYSTFGGLPKSLDCRSGKPTLIVLFASWCLPCRKELRELVQRQDEFHSAGIELVALAVDGIGEDGSGPDRAAALCERLKLQFTAGQVRPKLTQLLTGYHHMLVTLTQPLPVPSGFLVDGRGRLSVIYKGRMDLDQVLKDARSQPSTLRQRWERAACFPGQMIDHKGILNSLRRREANMRNAIADAFAQEKQYADAFLHYRGALEIEPDFTVAKQGLARSLYNLGIIQTNRQRLDRAMECYREAIELKTNYWQAHMNLGGVLLRQKRYAEAAVEYKQVLKINPKFLPAQKALKQLEALH